MSTIDERPLGSANPDAQVEPEVRYGRPADAPVGPSAQTDLLVLGRHRNHQPRPQRLGSVVRILIREPRGPIMVVPVTD